MRENKSIPWIAKEPELDAIEFVEGSGVILNDPSPQQTALSLGKTLRWALKGKTRSFNALVGFFGHNQFHDVNGDDPAAIIVTEGSEGAIPSDVQEGVGFRLLYGRTASPSASVALRAWYWLSRYRQLHRAETDRKRREILEAMHEQSFDAVSGSLISPNHPLTGFLYGNMPSEFDATEAWENFRGFLEGTTQDNLKAAGILLGFWIQRQADIRVFPRNEEVHLFHPKIYVVERDSTSIAIAGSANWSTRAFGGYAGANVEIATVHACNGTVWNDETGNTLASKLAGTARMLFDQGNGRLGSWTEPEASLVDAETAMEVTQQDPFSTDHEPEFPLKRPDSMPPKEEHSPEESLVAPVLKQIIEQTLGIDQLERFEKIERIFRDGIFAGRKPQRYQLDGATRLINILKSNRGAFLTDEPGLGKTLISQMVATYHLTGLLEERMASGSKDPVRFTIIAPARVIGDESGRNAVVKTVSGWFAFALEINDAVAAALALVTKTAKDGEYVQSALNLLTYRVLSTGAFSRNISEKSPQDVEHPEQHVLREGVVDDFFHVALSEFIILDESHNFRNASSRATRTLRFLTSLPVPGEEWPLERREKERFSGDGSRKRKVLCLSATPFNNRLEDITTQVGHFARIQNWDAALKRISPQTGGQTKLEATLLPLEVALEEWPHATEARRAHFEVLIRHAIRHFHSGRRLEAGDDLIQQTEAKNKVHVERSSDLGPTYDWHSEDALALQMTFGVALEWAKRVRTGEVALNSDDSDLARRRLDALLSKLVVQRSRARVLKIARALDGEQIEDMFRSPTIPRHPLPINQPGVEARFEAEVLGKLQQLMVRTVSSEEEDDEEILSLFSYRLGVRRGKQGKAGGKDQAENNQIGFQIANLTKRLQSSPYAFLRTILRGPFRRAIFELAVLEQMIKVEPQLTQPLNVQDALEYLSEQLASDVKESIATLLGGTWPTKGQRTLCGLIGAHEDGKNPVLKKQLDETVRKALDALAEGEHLNKEHWLWELVEDVKTPDSSQLWRDVRIVLNWANTELSESIYKGLAPAKFVGGKALPFKGEAMVTIQESVRCASKAAATTGQSPVQKMLGDWVEHRLDSDRRLLGLISWLLLQNAARLGDKTVPAGYKTLVFSEYTDTQEYIIAVLAALDHVFRYGKPTNQLIEILYRGAEESLRILTENVQVVQSEEPSVFSTPHLFRNPLDAEWARQWISAKEPAEMKAALLGMTDSLGYVSSKKMGTLNADFLEVSKQSDEVDDDIEEEEATSVGESPVLDAFSPWYQIAPNSSDRDKELHEGFRERLSAAANRPIYTLLATEVLSEGVNLQECGVVAHYDLPWNPTRLIQRNGRVDRRIFQTYEDDAKREALVSELGLTPDQSPPFSKPHQVYHLTVVPVEPVQERGKADIVRKVLFAKLETIRDLFGLSSWPVVLNNEVAKQVLHGERDFETPGFRRREELFAAWRQLRVSDERPPNIESGSLIIQQDERFLKDLYRGVTGSDEGYESSQWPNVTYVQIVTWTPFKTVSAAAHSEAEIFDDSGYITGTLFFEPSQSKPEFFTWYLKEGTPLKFASGLAKRNSFESMLLTLSHEEQPEDVKTQLPSSPSGFAEEILLAVAGAIANKEPHSSHISAHLPREVLEMFAQLEDKRPRGFYERQLNMLVKSRPTQPGDVDLSLRPERPSSNLWIRISKENQV